ncbi:HAMP domain-containing histidine kinase [Pedobacter frigiditerrae]|uniref:histidine kinase n=1 Tax=Pedobacter frigiditerrae TaxID=2530452 RepID=A0A4R0MNG4_9SPHI|nr:HAMP domain-containing sensor histidine kinase [Pedobacter frigiditerrae]TCC88037.1 HAMP domain-containing histidine kinase [Pedobacter frigiditerrae]
MIKEHPHYFPARNLFTKKSRTKLINLVCHLSAILALASALLGSDSVPYSLSMIALSGIFIASLLLKLNAKDSVGKFFVPLATSLWITYMCIAFGSELGTQNYLVIALVALAIYANGNTYRVTSILGVLIVAILVNGYQYNNAPLYPLPRFGHVIFMINVITPLAIISMMCWKVINQTRDSQQLINQQKWELQQSNQFKDRILSILGHDMRSPFNSTKSLIDMLDLDMLSTSERRTIVDQLRNDIDLSLSTLDNILAWASQGYYGSLMGTGVKSENLALADMASKTVAAFQHLGSLKKVSIINSIPSECVAYADFQQISFVLRNLTNNALKFSYTGGHITLNGKLGVQGVTISIKDQGTGMDASILSSLFNIGNRMTRRGTAGEKGSGLGLIFCKEFVENNGGKLWIESVTGQGTTVYFSLPAALGVQFS